MLITVYVKTFENISEQSERKKKKSEANEGNKGPIQASTELTSKLQEFRTVL